MHMIIFLMRNTITYLFHPFCCNTWQRVFEPPRVYEPCFNTDKYSTYVYTLVSAGMKYIYVYVKNF